MLCIVLNFQYTSSKLLRAGAPVLNKHITTLVNNTIKTSVFPTRLKEAQVVPLHNKNDPLDKKNYRPVSILPTISKVYEMVFSDQLTDLFENIFNTFLCAFINDHGCQTIGRMQTAYKGECHVADSQKPLKDP
jgi:hypothetical protein